MLSIHHLEKSFHQHGMNQPVLRGIDLEIPRGEIYGLVGPAKSGKSTLLRCINMLEHPTRGRISLDQIRFSDLPTRQLRQARTQIGMLFSQNFLMPSLNVWDNIALPLVFDKLPKAKHGPIIQPILATLDLKEKSTLFINQLTKLNLLKVALARILVMHPKILLCDEITQGLDTKSTLEILQLLQKIQQQFDLSLLLVTHNVEALKNLCHRIGFLENGRLVEEGKPLDILLNPKSNCGKKFLRNVTKAELPFAIRRKLKNNRFTESHPILRLAFSSNQAQEPLFAEVIEKFKVQLNIIQGHQETIQRQCANFLILEIQSPLFEIDPIIDFFKQQNIFAEVIGYVPNAA